MTLLIVNSDLDHIFGGMAEIIDRRQTLKNQPTNNLILLHLFIEQI